MFQWIGQNLATLLIVLVLVLLVGLVIVYLIRQKKKGKCVGCDSSHCARCQENCQSTQQGPSKKT
jgi:sensor histidine kinase regulating citrate/malate metabolism